MPVSDWVDTALTRARQARSGGLRVRIEARQDSKMRRVCEFWLGEQMSV